MAHRQKNILLGVTGGIAAYKACELARLLVQRGVAVRAVLTESATRFVTPMTFQALTGHPARTGLFDEAHEAAMGHIELARWADRVVVAPATADFVARLAQGRANDLLTTLCLATGAPVTVVPAMNQRMWRHPATRRNITLLGEMGVRCIGPVEGGQACGESGPGRMSEPREIVEVLLGEQGLYRGRKVMVTAGPTREVLDPVRYLSNRSSGRMGFALAEAFEEQGAEVTLVTGPVSLAAGAGLKRVDVESALEMREAVFSRISEQDLFVGCAAVADYRPEEPWPRKIKKSSNVLELKLVRNPDILAEVAALEGGPWTVGFAAETDELERHARQKLEQKGVDMIAANRVGRDLGFEVGENALEVFWNTGQTKLPMQEKKDLARKLVVLIDEVMGQQHME